MTRTATFALLLTAVTATASAKPAAKPPAKPPVAKTPVWQVDLSASSAGGEKVSVSLLVKRPGEEPLTGLELDPLWGECAPNPTQYKKLTGHALAKTVVRHLVCMGFGDDAPTTGAPVSAVEVTLEKDALVARELAQSGKKLELHAWLRIPLDGTIKLAPVTAKDMPSDSALHIALTMDTGSLHVWANPMNGKPVDETIALARGSDKCVLLDDKGFQKAFGHARPRTTLLAATCGEEGTSFAKVEVAREPDRLVVHVTHPMVEEATPAPAGIIPAPATTLIVLGSPS